MNALVVVRRELRALWGDGAGKSLVVIAGGWGLLLGARMIYPVLLPYFRESFGLSLTVAGVLVTILWLGSAVGQLPGGVLADRYSERLMMTIAALVVAVALVVVATAPTAVVLFVATGLLGLGQSLYPIARITILASIYPDRIGSALGVTMATGDVGQTILPPIAAVLAAGLVWQAGMGFMAPLLLGAGIVLYLTLPSRTATDTGDEPGSVPGGRAILTEMRRPSMVFMTGILFLYIFIWQSFTAFYPTYLMTTKELSPSVASVLFGFFFAVGVAVKPTAGAAYDRIGMRWSLVGILLPPLVGFLLLPALDSLPALVAITALISVMLGTGAITQSYLAEAFSEEMRGTGLGAVRTAAATLGAAGPVVFGVVGDYGYFDQGYVALAVIMAAVILLTLRMPTGPKANG